jgi:hypothetical protein
MDNSDLVFTLFALLAKKMRVCSRHSDNEGTISQIIIDRNSNKFSGCKIADDTNLNHNTGTEVTLLNFDSAWSDGLDVEEIMKEIQYHFDGLLSRKNLNIAVKDENGKLFRCRPFDYRTIRGNKITEPEKSKSNFGSATRRFLLNPATLLPPVVEFLKSAISKVS